MSLFCASKVCSLQIELDSTLSQSWLEFLILNLKLSSYYSQLELVCWNLKLLWKFNFRLLDFRLLTWTFDYGLWTWTLTWIVTNVESVESGWYLESGPNENVFRGTTQSLAPQSSESVSADRTWSWTWKIIMKESDGLIRVILTLFLFLYFFYFQ